MNYGATLSQWMPLDSQEPCTYDLRFLMDRMYGFQGTQISDVHHADNAWLGSMLFRLGFGLSAPLARLGLAWPGHTFALGWLGLIMIHACQAQINSSQAFLAI